MPNILHYLHTAMELITAEIELLNLRITYPKSFVANNLTDNDSTSIHENENENVPQSETYTWTGKSVQLTEIAYAIIDDVNYGKVSIKGLTDHIARMFNTEIKDCYGAYGDIKKRKSDSRTYYLDELATRLNRRMDIEDGK